VPRQKSFSTLQVESLVPEKKNGGQNMVPSNPAKSENVYTRIMMAGQPTPLLFDEALLRETNGEKMLSS